MLFALKPHPQDRQDAIKSVRVEVARLSPFSLSLRYEIGGDIQRIVVPEWVRHSRAEELWRTTCLEAFIRRPGGDAYFEFNFSPSGQWAAYKFDAYRIGMTALDGVEFYGHDRTADAGVLILSGELRLDRLGLGGGPLQLGLSAVIEDQSGAKSYWALAHPSDKPDFHHPDSFVLELP